MKTQINQQNANIAAVQPSAILYRGGTEGRRTATTGKRPDTIFGLGLLAQALCILLLAAAIAAPATAQNIFVSSFSGSATIGKYGPDGTVIDANFVHAFEPDFLGLSVSGTTLVTADEELVLYNNGVEQIDTTTGMFLNGKVSLPYLSPQSAVLGGNALPGGPYIFVLYGPKGDVGEYYASNGSQVSPDISSGSAANGLQMAGWTDAAGKNVHLYVTIPGALNHGSVLHITVNSSGITNSTLVSGLASPGGIAVSPDGQYVYVLNAGAISKYTSGGTFQWTSAPISGSPRSLAASAGAVFVTLQAANAVGAYYASTGATISSTFITNITNPEAIAVGPPACTHPPANLAAWYTLDQTGSAQEDLANENTATAYNTASITGEVAGALQFNGTNAYVEAPEQPQLDLGTGDFSFDAWVKVASSADDSGVVVLLDKRNASTIGYHFFLYNGKIGVQLADSNGYDSYISTAAVPSDNQWHLVAVTVVRNSPTGGAWYLDGAPIGTFDPTAHMGSLSTTVPLDIGVRSSAQYGGGYFKGGIDEVEIFSRALSSGEVLSLMQAGPAGKCKCATPPSNMVAWYAFDQAGSTQNDLAKGNTATAYGTTSIIGKVAGALQFNGTNSNAQAPSTSFNNLGTSDLSIDAWVRIANTADYSGVVAITDKRDQYPNPLRGYHFFLYDGKIGVQLADSAGYSNYISTTAVPADNQWHLIAVTVQRNSPTGGVWYLDGLPIDSPFNPTAHSGSLNSSAGLSVGTLNGGGVSYFKGGLDELEIFNRALAPNEVLSLMQAGSAGKCK